MLTNPFTRRRHSPNAVMAVSFTDVPGRAKIPPPTPGPGLSFQVAPAPFYEFVAGDLFEPGTGNWALLPTFETPINTTWGHGFPINQPITSQIWAHVQTFSQPTVTEFFFRGMPSNQFLLGNSLQMDINTGNVMPNPIDPSSGMPALSLDQTDTTAGPIWGYSGDDTGSTAPLSGGYAG
jgi:hypothetical protein